MSKPAGATAPTRIQPHARAISGDVADVLLTLVGALGVEPVATMVQRTARTVDRWRKKEQAMPVPEQKMLRDIFLAYSILAEREDDHTIRAWFLGMNPTLNDYSPIEVFVDGRARSVVAAARDFAKGA